MGGNWAKRAFSYHQLAAWPLELVRNQCLQTSSVPTETYLGALWQRYPRTHKDRDRGPSAPHFQPPQLTLEPYIYARGIVYWLGFVKVCLTGVFYLCIVLHLVMCLLNNLRRLLKVCFYLQMICKIFGTAMLK